MSRGTVVCVWTLLAAVGVAQQEPSANLQHERHRHRHNAPHRVETKTGTRFFTTRPSEVPLPLPNEDNAFVFAVFGDRTGGPAEGVNVLADAVRDVNLIEPDLVMTVGDLINGYNQTEAWMEQMREFRSIMGELLCPWFPVAGNHDVYWRPLDDPKIPLGQHDRNYEMHFGPLWYSFQHKNCNFVVLYSDEGDPATGEKTFSKPAAQQISEKQFGFLKEALQRGKDCQHQFIFLHHPRWLAGNYGNDWNDRVHPALKEAGNVSAVFAGHIHHMSYDPKDNIEYVTLATVGGVQSGNLPEAGFLHQYHLVTVRPEQVAFSAFPVGEAMNVREITADLQQQMSSLARRNPALKGEVEISTTGPHGAVIELTVDNSSERPIEFTLTPESADRNWFFSPEHTHGRIPAGESQTVSFEVDYDRSAFGDRFELLDFVLTQEYLARTTRYAVPVSRIPVPYRVDFPKSSEPTSNRALAMDGRDDTVGIPSSLLNLSQGPFTAEAWFNAESFSDRVGLLAKTEGSEFSIFLSNGIPSASVHLGGSYRSVRSDRALPTGQWHHIAMVYDGKSVALFLNGQLTSRTETDPAWKRTTNELPLYIGADPGRDGKPMSFFHGMIDDVRVTSSALYTQSFTPVRRLSASADTVLLYSFDQSVGPILPDNGPRGIHQQAIGGARLTVLDR